MKLRLVFLASLCATILGLLFWRNSSRYSNKTVFWRGSKSIIELVLIIFSAVRLPMILISWCCLWLTRPIQTPWIKVTVGTVLGTILGFMSLYCLEALIIASVFAVDDITGDRQGFLMNLHKAKQEHRTA